MTSVTDSLFKWLQTFPLDQHPDSITHLSDGVYIAQVLHLISPSFFNKDWEAKIRSDLSPENWRLRVSNLRKILDRIQDFYSDVLNQPLTRSFTLPDPISIGRDSQPLEIGKLLQLVIGVAVSCEKKEEQIQTIMGLEQDIQHGVMQAIQDLMDKDSSSMSMTFPDSLNINTNSSGLPTTNTLGSTSMAEVTNTSSSANVLSPMDPFLLREQIRRLQEDLQAANEGKEAIAQKCYELEKAVNSLRIEKEALVQENERLTLDVKNNVNQALNNQSSGHGLDNDDPSDESLRDRHFLKLQSRIELLQEDLIKTETLKDEYRVKIDLIEKELLECRLRNEELQRKAKEAKLLQDELDIHRHLQDKAEKYEQLIESYKKKLEELPEVKRKLKQMEERNKDQLRKIMELEEDLSKTTALKLQMDVYKKQTGELQEQVVQSRHKSENLEYEYKRLEEKFESLAQECEKMKREKLLLRHELDDVRKAAQRRPSSFNEDSLVGLSKELCLKSEMNPLSHEQLEHLQETIIRLESENSILRERLQEKNEDQLEASGDIILLRNKLSRLEAENEEARKRIGALQAKLEDGTALSASEAHVHRVQELRDAIKQIEILKIQLNDAETKNSALQVLVSKKDEEMEQMTAKYKKYVSRAKQVVKELEPISLQSSPGSTSVLDSSCPGSGGGSPSVTGPFSVPPPGTLSSGHSTTSLVDTTITNTDDIVLLKSTLEEKAKLIQQLQREQQELSKIKALKEMEERLITVSFHNLAANLQRRAAAERMGGRHNHASLSSNISGSFLSRQRQASGRRFNSQTPTQSDYIE